MAGEGVLGIGGLGRGGDCAIKEVFLENFPPAEYDSTFEAITKQIYAAGQVEISDSMPAAAYRELLEKVPALFDLLRDKKWDQDDQMLAVGMEFIFEGLTVTEKISRRRLGEISSFKSVDVY